VVPEAGAVIETTPENTATLEWRARSANRPSVADIDELRLQLISRYAEAGKIEKSLEVADKVKDRQKLVQFLLNNILSMNQSDQVFEYVERELDRMDHQKAMSQAPRPRRVVFGNVVVSTNAPQPRSKEEEPLKPIAEGKKSPKDECGKEWAMSTTTQYGLFPNGWDQESTHEPPYLVNETGKQLRDRLENAFVKDDLPAMKEFCESFIRLDDIPLSSPWFDTSGGRLQGRIKYTLNEKAKPVVELLRDIAGVEAESKKELVELAKKSLKRIEAITNPKDK
jgi:hypothetical protein